ncbi:hypothetical protein BDZ89DRAFT_1135107 [Hymenopellis radicata]|nr:hypothetical protein BDZ89DRAFT_1135107 [Hymenopellis radicata]
MRSKRYSRATRARGAARSHAYARGRGRGRGRGQAASPVNFDDEIELEVVSSEKEESAGASRLANEWEDIDDGLDDGTSSDDEDYWKAKLVGKAKR